MKIYLAGPMSGYPNFNFPAFHAAARHLRELGHVVFNPAERDIERDGKDVSLEVPNGDPIEAAAKGFSLRAALADDTAWICKHADCIALLQGWELSKGARAELALADALGITKWQLGPDFTS